MKQMHCLRCQMPLAFLKREKIQLGRSGTFLGDWPNIIAGALDTEIFYCPRCGKVELFMPDMVEYGFDFDVQEEDNLPPEVDTNIVGVSIHGVPQIQCPACGKKHDFDYPKCIFCGHSY